MSTTEILIKAAIIESQAVKAMQLAADATFTAVGRVALQHMASAHIWAVAVLTAEPPALVRARVIASARDVKPLEQYRPRMVG